MAPAKLKRWHSERCLRRAFPRTVRECHDAARELSEFGSMLEQQPESVRKRLVDSGIAGTTVNYRFSFDVAMWLASRAPNSVTIDWSELGDYELLDNLLRHVLQPSEDEYFDSGYANTREWLEQASSGFDGTDFDWLIAQLGDRRLRSFYRQLYDAADIPLQWKLRDHDLSKSGNAFATGKVTHRSDGMRARPAYVKKEITRPVDNILRLSKRRGSGLIDVAIASLAVRHRETNHFNYANPAEVYVADVGEGIAIAVFGLLPEYRYPLECTMGFLILSNGVPIGYGGSSVAFKQVNTGINIFDEYRGTEAAFLWVQVMRVYHALVSCTRFIANPYQLGGDNSEALRSGAFWFYYRLGYRPVDPNIRRLALEEQARVRRNSSYRSSLATLKRLASCDMHLTLPGSRQSEFFDEDWFATSSRLATAALGMAAKGSRHASASRIVRGLLKDLGIRSVGSWTNEERQGLRTIAPFIAALGPSNWTSFEKRELRKLLRAKGGKRELTYARLVAANDKLLQEMRTACRGA